MSQINRIMTVIAGASLLLASCQDGGNTESTTTTDSATTTTTTTTTTPQLPLAIADVPASPEYKDAKLSITNVNASPAGDSVKLSFTFDVKNYELKSQTADAGGKMCNNSDKGQHIHFILDNKPYVALYEPKHDITLAKGGEHYLMVFLSRSYHESVKSKGAAAVYHFKIDEAGKLVKMDNPKTPMVFYSRPKGDYIGKANTENVLLDYYVWNAGLSEKGYKVKAAIKGDGVDTGITMTDWKAHFLKNLPMGKPSITLTLLDKNGNKVDGPYTEVTREFNLAADEPMK